MKFFVRKYGQITEVLDEVGEVVYVSGNTVKTEVKNLKALFAHLSLNHIEVEEKTSSQK